MSRPDWDTRKMEAPEDRATGEFAKRFMDQRPFQCCGAAGESPCRSFSESCLNPANYEADDDARLIANLKDWLKSRSANEGGELSFNRRTVQRLVNLAEKREPLTVVTSEPKP